MQILTKKQNQFLKVLKEFIERENQGPTISELQEVLRQNGFKVESRRSVTQYLEALEEKEFIGRSGEPRGIWLVEPSGEVLLNVPIFGMANAGAATIYADQHQIGSLKISKKLLKKRSNIFALQVKGNSLNRAKVGKKYIEDGDWVIIDRAYFEPRNGDYVLSIIDGMANLKRFHFDQKNNQIILFSESTEMHPPIFIHPEDKYLINGKIIQVIKKPEV